MADILKGNYKLSGPAKKRQTRKKSSSGLTDKLEDSALANLGGSICFVMKGKTFVWMGEQDEKAGS